MTGLEISSWPTILSCRLAGIISQKVFMEDLALLVLFVTESKIET